MRTFALLAFAAFVGLVAAGCPEMSESKPGAQSAQAPPPPPPPAVGGQAADDDQYVPVEEVNPQQVAKEQAAADALEKMGFLVIREGPEKVVTSVNFLGNNRKIDEKITDLLPALYRTYTFNFADTEMGDEQLRALQTNRKVTSLVLGGTQVGDEGLAIIVNLSSLVSLMLPKTKITDAGLPHLTKLPNLAILELSDTKVTDRGLPEIAKCQNLNWLLLSGTEITDEGLQVLAAMPNLRRLGLKDTKVTERGIAALKAAKPNLSVDSGTRENRP
ncbi:MAG: hypothetical protein IT426_04160 [Pirellulales bacterium]|nr:hypothetical protein [Pirellulales bacterium]